MTKNELSQKVDEFIAKYQGQTKGYPTSTDFNGECLSIVKIYIKEVFGISPPPSGSNSAYGYWLNFPDPLGSVFTKVQNTPNGVPEKGCIPIWNTNAGGGFGHIAVFVSGDVNAFTSFDQNWNGRQAHLQSHDYKNVVGWLKPKLEVETVTPPSVELVDLKGFKTSEEIYYVIPIETLKSKLLAKDMFITENSEVKDELLATKVILEEERKRILKLEQENEELRRKVAEGIGKPLFSFAGYVVYKLA